MTSTTATMQHTIATANMHPAALKVEQQQLIPEPAIASFVDSKNVWFPLHAFILMSCVVFSACTDSDNVTNACTQVPFSS